MKKRFLSATLLVALLVSATWLTSCDDDDDKTGNFSSVISFENVTEVQDFVQSGTFQKAGSQPLIMPGDSVSFTFSAGRGQTLMFATMYGYSNDLFFAPENPGIQLFNSDGTAITGDVSSHIRIWDNGTRVNQAPGPIVIHPGDAENGNVTMISGTDAQGHTYPAASELMRLTLAYNDRASEFTATITNISGGKANETPFSPGVYAVPNLVGGNPVNAVPFFTVGEKSNAELTALAESGNVETLRDAIFDVTGIITTLSPAIVVIYTGTVNPIYTLNEKDGGHGLKALAETGNPNELRDYLMTQPNVISVHVSGTQSAAPSQKLEVRYEANEVYNIAYATMFGYSNDWFFTNNAVIGANHKGNITDRTVLLDNGTAVSQYPGAGNRQAMFGGTSQAEDNVITPVGNLYPVPAVSDMIKVEIR